MCVRNMPLTAPGSPAMLEFSHCPKRSSQILNDLVGALTAGPITIDAHKITNDPTFIDAYDDMYIQHKRDFTSKILLIGSHMRPNINMMQNYARSRRKQVHPPLLFFISISCI
jgi:hypothetical protein